MWASKSIATQEQKYGILEINTALLTSATETQASQIAELQRLSQLRQSAPAKPLLNKILQIFSTYASARAEDLPLTRSLLLESIDQIVEDRIKSRKILILFEKVFGKYYSEEISLDRVNKWYRIRDAFSKPKWTENHPLRMSIYHFASTYLDVYPEKISWFKEPDRKAEFEDLAAHFQYDPSFEFRPTFMRVFPTPRYNSSLMPFADVESNKERKANYFGFKQQIKQFVESLHFYKNKNFSTAEQLSVHIEFLARLHQAMIYYHFWEQLNGRMTRAYMSSFNVQYGLLPIILNVDPEFIDIKYKKANQIDLISGRFEKWKYSQETYVDFVAPAMDWIIAQQIKAEHLYLSLQKLFS